MSCNNPQHLLLEAVEHILDQKAFSQRSQLMELQLIKFVLPRLDDSGRVSISHAMLADLTGVSLQTIRRFMQDMVASGRWSIERGDGLTTTSYKPLFLEPLFLSSLAEAKKKGN